MPSPGTAVKETIAAAIATQLATINATTSPSLYANTVAQVVRPNQSGRNYQPAHLTVILVQGDAARSNDEENYDSVCWRQQFVAVCLVRQSDSATAAIDTVLNSLEADVCRCLAALPQWGGYALDTDITDTLAFDPIGHAGFEGVTIVFDVFYRTKRTDPASLA